MPDLIDKLRAEVEAGVADIARRAHELRSLTEEARTIVQVAEALGVPVPEEVHAVADLPSPPTEDAPPAAAPAPEAPKRKAAGRGKGQAQVLDALKELGEATTNDLIELLDLSRAHVNHQVKALREAGKVETESTGANTPAVHRPKKRRPPKPSPATVSKVRDFAVGQVDAFGPSDVMRDVKLPHLVALASLQELERQGIIRHIEGEWWSYEKPNDPGAAARVEAARRSVDERSPSGSAPVAGTGKAVRVRDDATRALLDDARAAGAEVTKAPNGHFDVRVGDRKVQVASTPGDHRTPLNDRARVRRELDLAV